RPYYKKPLSRPAATEEVFGKSERESRSSLNADGEQPIRRKKAKGKPSSYSQKPAKKSAAKSEAKAKDKVKKKAKAKKKKSNAKSQGE
ncbi:ribonuclease R, partial [Acinetobacter sp. RF14B]